MKPFEASNDSPTLETHTIMNISFISRLTASMALALLMCSASGFASAQSTPTVAAASTKYRAIFHVTENDPQKWAQVLNNAKFTQSQLGAQNVDIVVVMNGGGIGMLKLESPVAQRIDEAKKAGIKFDVCQQTMAAQKVTKQDMLPQADYVPSGVAEVIMLQSQGWLYVKN